MGNSFFDLITLYGTSPGFTVQGKRIYTTTLGYVTSITTLIIIILVIIFFLKEQILKIHSIIGTTITNDIQPISFHLGDDNFIFLVGIMYPNYTIYTNEKVYSLEVNYINQTLLPNGTITNVKTSLEVTTCDKVYIPIFNSIFSTLPLDQMYCIKNKTGIYLKGDFGLQQWAYLDFKFSQCIGETCYDNQTINDILKGGYISIYTSDFYFYPNEYKNPIELYGKNIFSSISNKIYKEMYIYYKTIQLETDDGWFAHNNKTEVYYSLRDYTENFDFREDPNNTFLHIYLHTTRTKYIYSRIYDKIDTNLTKIVCVAQLIYLFFRMISEFFNKDLYSSYICSFYDNDFRKRYQHTNSSNQVNLAHRLSQKVGNESSLHSSLNLEIQDNSNIYSSISGIINPNTPPPTQNPKQVITKNNNNSAHTNTIHNVTIRGITNNNKLNNSCFHMPQEMKNIDVQKKSIIIEPSQKVSGLYTQISNLTHQCEQSNTAKQKFYLPNSFKQKVPKTCDFKRSIDIHKITEGAREKKKKNLYEEWNIEKVFKSIQNPNYRIQPFTCSQLMKYLICQVDTFYEFKYIRKCYQNIGLFFEVIRFLKLYNEVEYLKKQMLYENQIKMLQHNFAFEKNSERLVKQFSKVVNSNKF